MKKTGEEFIEKTKYSNLSASDQMTGKVQPPDETVPESTDIFIQLPEIQEFGNSRICVSDVIKMRTSIREYSGHALSLRELAYLLWAANGIKEHIGHKAIRTVPSAGGRYALDLYLYLSNVHTVEPGIYQFLAYKNALVSINHDKFLNNKLFIACLEQQMVIDSAVVVFWVADIYRMTWRYSERGYRYIFLDAGHSCQNLYLATQQLSCGMCAMAAFDDDKVNKILHVDGKNRFTVYAATIGKINAE